MTADYYEQLVTEARHSIPESERTPKTFPEEVRRAAAKRLSGYMRTIRPFSFLRLGDMELGLLLADQMDKDLPWVDLPQNETESSSVAFGHPGLDRQYVARLRRSFEEATYVDFHERWWINRALNPMLRLRRPTCALRNAAESDSHLFFEWLHYEFKGYITNRRCLFAGAEAGILHELWKTTEYRRLASDYWPDTVTPFFQAEESLLSGNLDNIKERLADTIRTQGIDTLFLSLGGGAKILCAELAAETGICTFDFGGLMRGLCYAGSDGHAAVRSTHHPHFFRVPFELFMDAYEASHAGCSPERLLVKAQCQVLLELCDHQKGESLPNGSMRIASANRQYFLDALGRYQKRYSRLARTTAGTRRIAREFRLCCSELTHGEGSVHHFATRIRNRIERLLD